MTEGFRATGEKPPSPARKYFSLDYFTADQVYGGVGVTLPEPVNPIFKKVALVRFNDDAKGEEMVAVIRAGSEVLVDEISMIAGRKSEHPTDVTCESMSSLLDRFVESYMHLSSRPHAEIWTGDNGSKVTCFEESCRFHDEQQCRNPKPMIFDDCAMDQWCMTFEEKDGK